MLIPPGNVDVRATKNGSESNRDVGTTKEYPSDDGAGAVSGTNDTEYECIMWHG